MGLYFWSSWSLFLFVSWNQLDFFIIFSHCKCEYLLFFYKVHRFYGYFQNWPMIWWLKIDYKTRGNSHVFFYLNFINSAIFPLFLNTDNKIKVLIVYCPSILLIYFSLVHKLYSIFSLLYACVCLSLSYSFAWFMYFRVSV